MLCGPADKPLMRLPGRILAERGGFYACAAESSQAVFTRKIAGETRISKPSNCADNDIQLIKIRFSIFARHGYRFRCMPDGSRETRGIAGSGFRPDGQGRKPSAGGTRRLFFQIQVGDRTFDHFRREGESFRQRGMRMDRERDILHVRAHFQGQNRLGDQFAGVRADHARA